MLNLQNCITAIFDAEILQPHSEHNAQFDKSLVKLLSSFCHTLIWKILINHLHKVHEKFHQEAQF